MTKKTLEDSINITQINLLKHTLLISKKGDKSYRNYFCCGTKENTDYKNLSFLVSKGLMEEWEIFGDIYFSATEKGKEFVKNN